MMLFYFIALVLGITIYQESKTENALAVLRDLPSQRALAIRDDKEINISGREVARGDLLVLQESDRIAADRMVLSSHDLKTDESLLTGEPVAVDKIVGPSAINPTRQIRAGREL